MQAFDLFMATVNGQESGADTPIAPIAPIAIDGPSGELMMTLTGVLWSAFDQSEREGRDVTRRLAIMLDDHPDIEARLSLRLAQALARSLLGDVDLCKMISPEISTQAVSSLLMLMFRGLGYSDEEMRIAIAGTASALQGILAASGGSTQLDDIIRASDEYFGPANQVEQP